MKILKPSECSLEEIQAFHDLVLKGRQVNPDTLMDTIKNCALLGFIYNEDSIISIASIKNPNDGYKRKIFRSAKVEELANEITYEVGHAYTVPEHRKKGHHFALLNALIEHLPNERFYATTKNQEVPSLLLKAGFEQVGSPYKNKNGETLLLFTRDILK